MSRSDDSRLAPTGRRHGVRPAGRGCCSLQRSSDPGRVLGREPSRALGTASAGHARVRSADALRRILWSPDELGLARAYVAGDLDTEGDLFGMLHAMLRRDAQGHAARLVGAARWAPRGPSARAARAPAATAAGGGPAPRRGALAAPRRRGDRSPLRRRQRLLPDRARPVDGVLVRPLRRRGDGPHRGAGLQARADLPQARPARAARRPTARRRLRLGIDGDPRRHSTTTSRWSASRSVDAQADLARKRAAEAGVGERVDIRLQDYRELGGEQFDAISSIGMSEHVGVGPLGRVLRHPPRRAAAARAACSTTPSARSAARRSAAARSSADTSSPTAS